MAGRHGRCIAPQQSSLTLTTGGIMLLGVLLSIGVTVGFGLTGATWVCVAAGLATTVGLGVVVKLGTSSGRGPLARAADWMIGAQQAGEEGADPGRGAPRRAPASGRRRAVVGHARIDPVGHEHEPPGLVAVTVE